MVFKIWVDIDFKLRETDYFFIQMLWEQYYSGPNILYVNLLEEEEQYLNKGVAGGCYFIWIQEYNMFMPYPYHKRYIKLNASQIDFELNSELNPLGVYYINKPLVGESNSHGFELSEIKEIDGRYFVDGNSESDKAAMLYYNKLNKKVKLDE